MLKNILPASQDISERRVLHRHDEYRIYVAAAKAMARMIEILFLLYEKNTDKEFTVIKVANAESIWRSSQPDSSNGVFVDFTAVPSVSDAVNRLLIAITIKSAFAPIRGTRNAIKNSLNAESERLNLRSADCLPRPLRIPQETESRNITGEKSAMIRTDGAM